MRLIDADELLDEITEDSYRVITPVDCSCAIFHGMILEDIAKSIDSISTAVDMEDYDRLCKNGLSCKFSYRGFTVEGEWSDEDNAYSGMVKDGVSGYIEVQGNTLEEFYDDFCNGVDDYIAFRDILGINK